jgi:hypothetical protein
MLAGTTRDIPLVVLATFRDTDLTQSHPLPVLLADLWRERDIRRVNLGGLNAHEVAVLAKQVIGTDVDNDLVERLHAQMGGNPFFTVQMLREMAQTSRSVDNLLPLPILEVIRQRVHKLGDAVATALQVGAVLGEQIDVNLLEHSLQRVLPQAPPTLDLLDTAVAAGLVIESRGPPGQFHFAHDLIRQAILNDIGTTRQARMHGVLAATMEELNLEDPSIPVRVIAEHFSQGASAKDRLRGGALTVIAAHEVPTRLSPDDVVDLAERTMATLPDGAAGDRLRLELLSLIADAQFARFDNTAHRQAVIDAVEVAMRLDDAVADKAPLDSTFAEGAPADPGGVDHPHEDSGREVSERPRGKTGRHGKWKNIVAVSIATVSVLGAITSWRIETHATAASGFEQSAVAATITNTRLNVESRVEAQQFYDEFLRYERLSDEATQLAPAGCPDNHVSVLDYNAQVVCQMKQSIFNGGNDGYVNSNHRTYDISALTRDLVAQNGFELDNQPKPYQDLAAVERHSEDRLLLLTLLLVLSLALLTVAHLARRRKVLLATATPAWVLMVIGAALLVAWEL